MSEPLRDHSLWDPGTDEPPFPAPPERGRVAETALQVCGVIAMASPLALWIAWTGTILLLVLAVALACIAACWLIVYFGK